MQQQTFDTLTRVIECAHCGAPLAGSEQTQVRCAYCGAANQVELRPREAVKTLTPAQQIARMSALKAQFDHPVPGHVYDMDSPPPRLAHQRVHNRMASAEYAALWSQLRARPGPRDLEDQRSLTWVAIRAATTFSETGRPREARAKLETALDLVEDSGLRHLLRCELALCAIRAGEAQAARSWLNECDPWAEVLELDSIFRMANARLALLEGKPQEALQHVGAAPGVVPLDASYEQHAKGIRAHAAELMGHAPVAMDESELKMLRNEQLAPGARLQLVKQSLRKARANNENSGSLIWLFLTTLMKTPYWALLLALLATVGGCITETGPVGGLTSEVLCPQVCSTCRGPYTHVTYTVNDDNRYEVLCDDPSGRPSSLTRGDAFLYINTHRNQLVPGGGWTLFGVAFFVYCPLALVTAFLRTLQARGRMLRRRAEFERQITSLEQELATLGGNPNAEEVTPRFMPQRFMIGVLIIIWPVLLMGGCLGVNLGLRVQ
ncbi:MAG: hypothetical protein R3B07_05125 [Polyangiaceae bacterium]